MNNKKKNVAVITVLCVLLIPALIYKCENKTEKKPTKPLTSKIKSTAYQKPIEGLDIPYQYFEVDPKVDNVIITASAATIRVPKNAFLDDAGNPITSKVKLEYREFRNPLDFYVSGIPMELIENGEDKVFVSGGMFEINAINAKNTSVFVNPNNKIKVDLLSTYKSKDFNVYDLDKETNQWISKGKDHITVTRKEDEIESLNIPHRPQIAKSHSFTIKDDTGEYPEISEYENVKFTPVDPAKCKISNAQEMKVIPRKHGLFEVVSILKFGSLRKENTCLCYLSFEEGKDYSEALKTYQKKYGAQIAKRDSIEKLWKKYEFDLIKNKIQKSDLNEKITRTLEVNQFGFVNLDYPTSYPTGVELPAVFADINGNKLSLRNIVLIEKGTNAIYRYKDVIKFNLDKDNILCGITEDNKLAYIKKDELAKHTKTSKRIKMRLFEGKLTKYEDVYSFLFAN
jgi:hypothetical protein